MFWDGSPLQFVQIPHCFDFGQLYSLAIVILRQARCDRNTVELVMKVTKQLLVEHSPIQQGVTVFDCPCVIKLSECSSDEVHRVAQISHVHFHHVPLKCG